MAKFYQSTGSWSRARKDFYHGLLGFVDLTESLSGLECGTQYFFQAVADNSEGRDRGVIHAFTTSACASPNSAPTITVGEPDGVGDIADDTFMVTWNDADSDDDASISLAYSLSSDCSNPVSFASGISEDSPQDSFVWTTSVLPPATYYVLATIDDGINPSVASCSLGGVLVNHGVSRLFSDGFESGDVSRWSTATISNDPELEAVFADNFDDDSIDLSKWEVGGFDARETSGQLHLTVNVTDQWGWAETQPFTIDPDQPLTITRRVRVFAANDFYDGNISIHVLGHDQHTFGVSYANYHFTGSGECVTVGFSVFRNKANSHRCADQVSDTSELIAPVWGTWFMEQIVYDPRDGDLRYFIDGVEKISYNVGSLPSGAERVWLSFSTWGWSTGHYHHMDSIEVRSGG